MATLKEQRETAFKAAEALIEKVKAGEESAVAEAEAQMAKVKEYDGKIAAAAKSAELIKAIGEAGMATVEARSTGGAKSLGEHFVKSLGDRSLKSPGTFVAPEFKAASDTQSTGARDLTGAFGPLVTDIDRQFVLPKRERLVVADLLGSGTVSGNAITYPVFGALEGGTAFIGEGGQKPQMHVGDPTWVTDALGEVAGWFKLTDDMAEDLDYVVSEINSTALYDLAVKEEAALLNGSGTSPNLRGILNRTGVQTHAQSTDTVADAIFKALGKVQTATGFTADAIVINPQDYEALRLQKDTNGQYFGGGFFSGQYGNGVVLENPPLWGRRTVTTTAIAAGTVLVGAFSTAAKVFRKGGVRVESTNSHDDDFTNDKITVRVRERLGLQVKYPSAFVKVTLGGE